MHGVTLFDFHVIVVDCIDNWNRTVPAAVAIMKSETKRNWTDLFQFYLDVSFSVDPISNSPCRGKVPAFGASDSDSAIDSGIHATIQELYPEFKKTLCTRHLKENLKKKLRPLLADHSHFEGLVAQISGALRATSREKLDFLRGVLLDEQAEWKKHVQECNHVKVQAILLRYMKIAEKQAPFLITTFTGDKNDTMLDNRSEQLIAVFRNLGMKRTLKIHEILPVFYDRALELARTEPKDNKKIHKESPVEYVRTYTQKYTSSAIEVFKDMQLRATGYAVVDITKAEDQVNVRTVKHVNRYYCILV